MGFFERPDPRLAQSADPAPSAAIARALKRQGLALLVCFVAIAALYAIDVGIGLRESAATQGSFYIAGLHSPVTIVRDERDVPHIRAADEHDLYFAQGYVEGSDRLFQLDLSRRYAYGRLAEVLGPKALPYDKAQRAVNIDGIARRQLDALAPRDRSALLAFSDGVNAAAETQPLPVEFRILIYRPAAWSVKDSLAVSIVASLELADSWHDIFARDAVWRRGGERCFDAAFPLSDARYDVGVAGTLVTRKTVARTRACDDSSVAARASGLRVGSNTWAAGGARSSDGNALLANDPHIDLTVPGIWYLVELDSPQVHVAGAAIPGIPGVALGHNERLAWASVNAAMATTSSFQAGRLSHGSWATERIGVRFARDVLVRYYRTAHEFSVADENDPSGVALVRWPIYAESHSTIATELAIDRARSAGEALRVLSRYRGSPQGFMVADRSGAVAYHVAGIVPNDPAWGRYVHPARDLREA
ncbi:MAG: penicillin acylase family protein, partial [Candidatus Eremiobacteraeota bacterium]|nr:penicillin acylase family protein [Candidatus Eremiobacteraeota bacterium]